MIYFISDTHFGHKGSLTWPDGNARKFKDVYEMNQVMVNNWNSVVTEEDIVYHLGDFAYKTSASTIRHIFSSLKGTIIFIKGNHDGMTLKTNKKHPRFNSVHDILELEYNGKLFILCHYPIESWKNKNKASIHLHGHTHGNSTNVHNRLDVSVEVFDYKPISIEEVLIKLNL